MITKDPIRYGLPLYRQVTGAPRLYGLDGVLTGRSESETIAMLQQADTMKGRAWLELTSSAHSLILNSATQLTHALESNDRQLDNAHRNFATEAPKWFSNFDAIYNTAKGSSAAYGTSIKDIQDSVKLFTGQETLAQQAEETARLTTAMQQQVSEEERQAAAGGIVSYGVYQGVQTAKAAAAATGLNPFELMGIGTGSLVALGAGIFGALWLLKKV